MWLPEVNNSLDDIGLIEGPHYCPSPATQAINRYAPLFLKEMVYFSKVRMSAILDKKGLFSP